MRARGARIPSLRQPSAWLVAVGGLVLFAGGPVLSPGSLPASAAPPPWLAWIAPPALYALLCLGLPGVPVARRLVAAAALTL